MRPFWADELVHAGKINTMLQVSHEKSNPGSLVYFSGMRSYPAMWGL